MSAESKRRCPESLSGAVALSLSPQRREFERIAVLAEGCGAPTGPFRLLRIFSSTELQSVVSLGARASEAEIEGGERAPPATRTTGTLHLTFEDQDPIVSAIVHLRAFSEQFNYSASRRGG
eukprot:6463189-Amphidinium_carterae.1